MVASDNPKDLGAAFRKGVLGCPRCCQEISEGASSNNRRIPRILQQRKSQIILGLNKTKQRKKCCSPSPASLDSNHRGPPTYGLFSNVPAHLAHTGNKKHDTERSLASHCLLKTWKKDLLYVSVWEG